MLREIVATTGLGMVRRPAEAHERRCSESEGRRIDRPTTDADKAAFLREAQGVRGSARSAPRSAPDPVNQAMIRHWVEAMGDKNPVYTDPEAAAAVGARRDHRARR